MSQQLISRSPDLRRLRDEGYDIEVRANHLLLNAVPYVNSRLKLARGTLVSPLNVAGDVTVAPSDHVIFFAGEHPCRINGQEILEIKHSSGVQQLGDGIVVNHSFSAKPKPEGRYRDFHHKMTTYAAILAAHAQQLEPGITACTYPLVEPLEGESVFNYLDAASSRAGINVVASKLAHQRIAIVGVGGTGSYILDFVAKTLVREIHLYDGDEFINHNAFRAPGAPSLQILRGRPRKVDYFAELYSKMHRGIRAHAIFMGPEHLDDLEGMDFVFLCLDRGAARRAIIERLEALEIEFIDVGMGVELIDDSLRGILRVTTSTPEKREHAEKRIPFSDGLTNNDYARNIQIAELNALNAALAVIKWKKLCGFYQDLEREHSCAYTINGNALANEDQA